LQAGFAAWIEFSMSQFDNLAGSAPIHRQMGQAHSLSLVGRARVSPDSAGLTVGHEIAWICAPSISARL
jgi:hypothetical protein